MNKFPFGHYFRKIGDTSRGYPVLTDDNNGEVYIAPPLNEYNKLDELKREDEQKQRSRASQKMRADAMNWWFEKSREEHNHLRQKYFTREGYQKALAPITSIYLAEENITPVEGLGIKPAIPLLTDKWSESFIGWMFDSLGEQKPRSYGGVIREIPEFKLPSGKDMKLGYSEYVNSQDFLEVCAWGWVMTLLSGQTYGQKFTVKRCVKNVKPPVFNTTALSPEEGLKNLNRYSYDKVAYDKFLSDKCLAIKYVHEQILREMESYIKQGYIISDGFYVLGGRPEKVYLNPWNFWVTDDYRESCKPTALFRGDSSYHTGGAR